MPAYNSLWIVTAPVDSNQEEQLEDLQVVIGNSKPGVATALADAPPKSLRGVKLADAVAVDFPEFKTGTLSDLLSLSEALSKHDQSVTASLAKVVDTIRTLTSPPPVPTPGVPDRSSPLASHLVVDDGRPYFDYVFPSTTGSDKKWEWNKSKYRTDNRTLAEVIDLLVKEAASVENGQRQKVAQYMLVKGQLSTAIRKKAGNLSVRSLAEAVSADDFENTSKSEFLETVLVAVPKNAIKEWESSYEQLASMVVPRSSTKLASDDDFTLFSTIIFRKVHDEFAQKCRDNKFIIRDFTFDAEEMEKQRVALAAAEIEEKELWTDLLRLSRINFSEIFQILVHLKIVRAYVESVLRYGLPAKYFVAVLKPEPHQAAKLLGALSWHYASLNPSSRKMKKGGKDSEEAPLGEFANVLEGDYFDFVLFEVEKVESLAV